MSARQSQVHGIGLFATKRFKKKDIICLYSGDVVSKSYVETTQSKYLVEINVGKGILVIDGQDVNNFSGRWINHRFRPNARLVEPAGGILKISPTRYAIIVECLTEIKEDEEVFINYGWQYFIYGGMFDRKSFMYGA